MKTPAMYNTMQQSPANANAIKVGATQIKPIINTSTQSLPQQYQQHQMHQQQQPQPVIISQPPIMKPDSMDTNKGMVKEVSPSVATIQPPPPPPPVIPIPSAVTLPPPSSAPSASTIPSSTSTASSTNASTSSVSKHNKTKSHCAIAFD